MAECASVLWIVCVKSEFYEFAPVSWVVVCIGAGPDMAGNADGVFVQHCAPECLVPSRGIPALAAVTPTPIGLCPVSLASAALSGVVDLTAAVN